MGVSRVAADLVSGRYRLLRVIGAGGMGRVWLADDELLDRRVAIKEIATPVDAGNTQMLDMQLRTVREARAAARLDHPAVITVFDVVWRPGQAWIVMEYVKSRSLHDAVRDNGPMSHREAARIGQQILGGLRAAHAMGVLHRDVKPHNVLLADDGRVVLTDFGLATFEGAEHGSDPLMGSPHFVAPERLRTGPPSGEAADLWSLGATLYTAVEGKPPFARSTTEASLGALLTEPPDPPKNGGLLTPVIMALLNKEPQLRPAARVEEALGRIVTPVPRQVGAGTGIEPAERPVSGAPTSGGPARGLAPVRPVSAPPRPARSRRGAVIAVVAAVAALAAGIGTTVALADDNHDKGTSGQSDPGKGRTGTGAAPAYDPCGFTATRATPVGPTNALSPMILSVGWIWHQDSGFALPLPDGWTRAIDGSVTCFRDPRSSRAFTVDAAAPLTAKPLAYWQMAERTRTSLPGYRRIGMADLPLKSGAADYEYSWTTGNVRQHTRQVLVATSPHVSYLLGWTTTDQDWSSNLPVQQRIVTGFQQSS
jgi:eukaryotic-like serine/threonine-protein kinase